MIAKNILCFLFLSVFSVTHVGAQELLKIKKKDFKTEKKYGFKEAKKSIQSGNVFFEGGPGTYQLARKAYLSAYSYNRESAPLNYMIGICYLYTDDKYKALEYLQKAVEINPEVSSDIHFMMGNAYRYTYRFTEAIEEYEKYRSGLSGKNNENELFKVSRVITQCNNGLKYMQDPKRVLIQNMGKHINSKYDDYYPVVDKNDSIMFFTSRRQQAYKDERHVLDNKFFEDVYYSVKKKDGEWKFAQRMGAKTIGEKNEDNIAAAAISRDYNTLYLYKGGGGSGDIYTVKRKKGQWWKPKKMKGKVNSSDKEFSLTFSNDGNTMYFARKVEKKKNNYGGVDLFYTRKNAKGKWSKAKNMGAEINTPFNEIYASPGKTDSILYICSNGHDNMGGFDIYKTTLDENGRWSKPENLGYPINTPDDDMFYTSVKNGRTAYYTTIRESGEGGKDLHKIVYLGEEKEMAALVERDLFAAGNLDLAVIFDELIKSEVDTNIRLIGKIIDMESRTSVPAKIQLIHTLKSEVIATTIADTSGIFSIRIKDAVKYGIEISANGFMMYHDVIDLSEATYEKEVEKTFELQKLEVGAKVVLKNIYFETSKATLKAESFEELDNVVKLLDNNPSLRIEISGHTDSQGSAKTNLKLSAERAKAVALYMQGKGIDKERLEYKGYGFSDPIAPNNTAEGRAKNRRVEFKILSK